MVSDQRPCDLHQTQMKSKWKEAHNEQSKLIARYILRIVVCENRYDGSSLQQVGGGTWFIPENVSLDCEAERIVSQ